MPEQLTDDEFLALFRRPPSVGRWISSVDSVEYLTLNNAVEYLPLIEGVLLFLAPWVLGFSGVTAMAWSAWVIGILAFINAGSVFVDRAGMMGRRAQSN
jgi:hypothetical protein